MVAIIIPRKRLEQPQGRVQVDTSVWPRHQVFLPSLGYSGVLGGVESISLPSANQPFSLVGPMGREAAWRLNTSTLPGESHGWTAGNFDVGNDASMIFIGRRIDSFWAGVTYGGASWGLWVGFNETSAVAAYVDSPTSASYTATLSGSGAPNGELMAVGLTKLGNTVKVFCRGRVASATGGNGGIRRSAGSGLRGQDSGIDGRTVYAASPLAGLTSTPMQDAQMFELLENPWQLFRADPIRIYSLPAATIPSSLNVAASNITSSGARATVTLAF